MTNIPLEKMYEIRGLHVDEHLSSDEIARRTGYPRETTDLYAEHEAYEWDSELRDQLSSYGKTLNSINRVLRLAKKNFKEEDYTAASLFQEIWDNVREENPQLPYMETIAQIKEMVKHDLKKQGEQHD